MIESAHKDNFTRRNLPTEDSSPEFTLKEVFTQYPDRLNASVFLLEGAIKKVGNDKKAIIGAEGEKTYGQLNLLVKKYAEFLESQGVISGNRVLLRGPNNISIVAWWLAILRVGAVAVTTIHLQRSTELGKIVEIGQVQYAFVDHRYMEDWKAVSNYSGKTFIYGSKSEIDAGVLAEKLTGNHLASDTSSDDVALLAFTSGSTGIPKATMHFHRDILAIADTFSHHIVKPVKDDLFTGTPPIAFTFGLGGLVIFPFRVGATAVLFEAITPPQLLEKIAELKITCLFTAPTAYRGMLAHVTKENTASLRRCISAGEHLPQRTWQSWFDATGIKLIDGIGTTELLHIFISAADDEIIPGMTGKVVPGYHAMVVDEEMNQVPDGVVGRLAVKGPTGCRYLNDERQKVYVVSGWNLTGDLFIQHPNGYFQYQSRSDDMIISSGYNIAAPEVENAILSHPAVAETAVIGLPDPERGNVVVAYIVLKPDAIATDQMRKEIQDHVKAVISPFKYPRVVNFVDSLPKTTTGKLQRFRLKSDE